MIAACLLLLLDGEDEFWIMVTIVEDLLPASYYSSTIITRNPDLRVNHTAYYVNNYKISYQILTRPLKIMTRNFPLSPPPPPLFLTLFASAAVCRYSSIVSFQITLSMLKMKELQLKQKILAQIFNKLSNIFGNVENIEK